MTYEARPNGTHALTCNTPQCNGELIAPNSADLFQDASAAGWIDSPPNDHTCGNCSRGINVTANAVRAQLGGDRIEVPAPGPVKQGEPYVDPDGTIVGFYVTDADMGDMVEVELDLPTLAAQLQVSPQYAAILGFKAQQAASSAPAPRAPGERFFDRQGVDSEEEDVFAAFDELPLGDENSVADSQDNFPPVKRDPFEGLDLDESEAAQLRQDERDRVDLERIQGRKVPTTPLEEDDLEALFHGPASSRDKPTRSSDDREIAKRSFHNRMAKQAGKPSQAMAAPPGTAGGAGLVKEPPRLSKEQMEKAAIAAGKKHPDKAINIDELLKTSNLFGSLTKGGGFYSDDK